MVRDLAGDRESIQFHVLSFPLFVNREFFLTNKTQRIIFLGANAGFRKSGWRPLGPSSINL
jgi:hypothetical protein